MREPEARQARVEVLFDGDVQGVGFRYYVKRVAGRFKLVGFVENLEDGRVRVVSEGGEDVLQGFIQALRQAPPPMRVEGVQARYSEPTGEFKSFRIVTDDLAKEMVEGFSTWASTSR